MLRSRFRTATTVIATAGMIALALTTSASAVPVAPPAVEDVVDKVRLGAATWYRSGPLPGLGAGNNSQPGPEDCWTWDQNELNFFDRISNARDQRKLGRVQLDPELSKVASHHSYNMKIEDRLYHTPEDKLRERVTRWNLLGENVGTGGDVDTLFQAFMDSQPHREIILHEPFNHVGIGVAWAEGGRLWVTLLFEAHEDPGTTMDMREGAC